MSDSIQKNDLIIRTAWGEKTDRTPCWIMRQAGRYLPEFRELRVVHEFFERCRNPEIASELTMQPIRRYSGLLDAAIIFSDILVIPQAMGMEVLMISGTGPSFPQPLKTPEDLNRLTEKVDVQKELGYVFDAIRLTQKKLDGQVPLIGFCGAPWTLMAYMIEGGGSKTFEKAKRWLYMYPEESKQLLKRITDVSIEYLVGQVKAGAQMLQVFDSWAGELSVNHFEEYCLPSLRTIALEVRKSLREASIEPVPMIVFAKGALGHSIEEIAKSGYDVVGLDWTIRPQDAVKRVKGIMSPERNHQIVLQGNMDNVAVLGGREAIEKEVERTLIKEKGGFGNGNHIYNFGHGFLPPTDPDDVRFLLECVHKYGKQAAGSQ